MGSPASAAPSAPSDRRGYFATSSPSSTSNMSEDWANGMFGCMSDFTTCLYGTCCGCCMMYETAEGLGESGILYLLLSCITPCIPVMMMRMKAREKYNIDCPQGDTTNDALMSCCCNCCTGIQVYSEMKAREAK